MPGLTMSPSSPLLSPFLLLTRPRSTADGFLLGGILLIYRFSSALRLLLLLFYAFWVPQIITSVIRDSRRPLHLHYIIGISLTRLAIPLYIFGCPRNFMRVQPSPMWCLTLVAFVAAQVAVLLSQHYFGPRWFIPKQVSRGNGMK